MLVDKPQNADYLLLSTCGTADSVTQKSIRQIEDLGAYHGELIVIGCLPDTDREKMDEVFTGRFVKNTEMYRLDEIFHTKRPFSEFEDIQMSISNSEYYIEICRGCVEHCAYCAIRKAVGPIKSTPLRSCVSQINAAIAAKPERLIIGAENIGAYGYDIKTNLAELLDNIDFPEGSLLVRLNNFHPRYLIKYSDTIIRMLKKRTIGLLKIPVQSGNQRILDLMNRRYSIKTLGSLLDEIKVIDESVIIMTDIIVGFPGETLDSLKETCEFIKRHLDIGRIFVFTTKANTKASLLPDQLEQKEKENMLQVLLDYLRLNEYVININDDFVHTFCRVTSSFDENNPYNGGVRELFIKSGSDECSNIR